MPGFEDRPPVGPRRTKSLPSKYMIPSENMGEYDSGDPNRRRSAPPQSKVRKQVSIMFYLVDGNLCLNEYVLFS